MHKRMKKAEKHKLESWSALRGRKSISFTDVLSIQPMPFWAALILLVSFGLLVYFEYGPQSLPFGVFIGGFASTLGYITRIKRSLSTDLRYINWEAVNEALSEEAPN